MFTDDIAAANGMDANLIEWPLAHQAFTPVPGVLVIAQLASYRDQFCQLLCRAAGGIFL